MTSGTDEMSSKDDWVHHSQRDRYPSLSAHLKVNCFAGWCGYGVQHYGVSNEAAIP